MHASAFLLAEAADDDACFAPRWAARARPLGGLQLARAAELRADPSLVPELEMARVRARDAALRERLAEVVAGLRGPR